MARHVEIEAADILGNPQEATSLIKRESRSRDRDKNGIRHPPPRRISPTPIESMQSIEESLIAKNPDFNPMKAALSSFAFVNNGSPQNYSGKQLYDYIELITLKHVYNMEVDRIAQQQKQNNQKTNTINSKNIKPISLDSVRKTLLKLKELLTGDAVETDGHDHEHEETYKAIEDEHSIIKYNDNTVHVYDVGFGKKIANDLHNHSSAKNGKKIEPELVTAGKKKVWSSQSTMKLECEFIPSSALLHHPWYSIDTEKFCGLLRGSIRQDWNTIESDDDEQRNWEELKPHWFELFFDLMFVAAIVHISGEVNYAYKDSDYIFIYSVFPQFGLLVLCWLEQVLYASRFRMKQTGDGLLRFIYMAFVLWMGLSIGDSNNQITSKLFLICYCCTKLVMSIMFIKAMLIPRARNHSIYMLIENIVSIIAVIFVEVFIDIKEDEYEQEAWKWMVVYWALFFYSWFHMVVVLYLRCIRDLGINIPINVPHIAERMGCFVLIILGETIISILAQHVESRQDELIRAYIVTMGFFVIVYCIGKMYFESQPTEHELHHHQKSHAMSSSVWRARVYKWFHILLFFGLLGLGLGSKITVYQLSKYEPSAFYVFMPGLSCILICICVNVIRLTHPFNYDDNRWYLVSGVWVLRFMCIVIMFGILFAWNVVNHYVILGIYVLCFIIQIIVDFEARTRLIVEKKMEKQNSIRAMQHHVSPKKQKKKNGMHHNHGNHHHHQNGDNGYKHHRDLSHYESSIREMSLIGHF